MQSTRHPSGRSFTAGATPTRVRNHNERLVLSTVQSRGEIASADIARFTDLSAQTASVITRALEADGLLERGAPVRGKVGKPLTPMRLNPDGVFSFGLRIGRRRADLVLMDFVGELRGHLTTHFAFPTPSGISGFLETGLETLTAQLSAPQRARIVGLCVAAPFEMWNWLDTENVPKADMMSWKSFDFRTGFSGFCRLPVSLGNDATLACSGEHIFGTGKGLSDFGYFYIGSFAGGGMVLGGRLHVGTTGNAGAFGSIPVRDISNPDHQLIHNASIFVLERMLKAEGRSAQLIAEPHGDWSGFDDILQRWLDQTATHLATACVAVTAVLDLPTIILDGTLPDTVRQTLTRMVNERIRQVDTRGVQPPEVIAGELGHMAGPRGAAYQPIMSEYLVDGSGLI